MSRPGKKPKPIPLILVSGMVVIKIEKKIKKIARKQQGIKSFDDILNEILELGLQLYEMDKKGKSYTMRELVFCQSCGERALEPKKVTFQDEIFNYCPKCYLEEKYVSQLKKMFERSYNHI